MGFADVTRTDAVFPASRPTVLQPSTPLAPFAPPTLPHFPPSLFPFFDDDYDDNARVVEHDDADDADDKHEEQEDDVNGRGDGRVGGKGVAESGDGEGCSPREGNARYCSPAGHTET